MRLILLPGMDGTGLLFGPLQNALGDLPHTVLSYPGSEEFDYDQATEHIKNQLPSGEDIVLLAESYSGRVAYNLATQNVANIKGVIFVVSFLSSPRPILLTLASVLPLSLLFRIPLPNWLLRLFIVGPESTNEVIKLVKSALKQVRPVVLAKRLRDIGKQSLPSESIAVNCYYLQAADDRLVTGRSYHEMRNLMSHIVKSELAGPHLLLEANSTESAGVISKILGELS